MVDTESKTKRGFESHSPPPGKRVKPCLVPPPEKMVKPCLLQGKGLNFSNSRAYI